jgi:hypothetical protein
MDTHSVSWYAVKTNMNGWVMWSGSSVIGYSPRYENSCECDYERANRFAKKHGGTIFRCEINATEVVSYPIPVPNQCDGCSAGLPINDDGIHYNPTKTGYERLHMVCCKAYYAGGKNPEKPQDSQESP